MWAHFVARGRETFFLRWVCQWVSGISGMPAVFSNEHHLVMLLAQLPPRDGARPPASTSPILLRARHSMFKLLFLQDHSLPPGPIFYYGGLYGEIRARTKYNTTLVTRGRFPTSSAAAPK
jgi:hypothetical protein